MDRLKEPIINGELDVTTGYYWCSWGCGPTTNDPWEAMWHEVGHFSSEEDVEGLKQDYGPIHTPSVSCRFVVELTEGDSTRLRVWHGRWKNLY